MSELLTNLKLKSDSLGKKYTKLSNDVFLSNIRYSSNIREILAEKFSRLKEVIVDSDTIIIQVRSDDDRYSHDVTINNVSHTNFIFNPRLQWISATIKKESLTLINYINVVAFIASEITKDNSELCNLMQDALNNLHNTKIELYNLKNELNRTIEQIAIEERRIKRDLFYSTLKVGNYYYLLQNRHGRISYSLVYINKINPKTLFFSRSGSTEGYDTLFEAHEKGQFNLHRVKIMELYDHLNSYTLFKKEDFNEIVINNKFKYGIDYIYKQNGLSQVKDIKALCIALKNHNITTENVPSNDVLHYISKWRHSTLKENKCY